MSLLSVPLFPAKAGIHSRFLRRLSPWTPAFAGENG